MSRHQPRQEREEQLCTRVRDVLLRDGRVLLPCVALGRAQVRVSAVVVLHALMAVAWRLHSVHSRARRVAARRLHAATWCGPWKCSGADALTQDAAVPEWHVLVQVLHIVALRCARMRPPSASKGRAVFVCGCN